KAPGPVTRPSNGPLGLLCNYWVGLKCRRGSWRECRGRLGGNAGQGGQEGAADAALVPAGYRIFAPAWPAGTAQQAQGHRWAPKSQNPTRPPRSAGSRSSNSSTPAATASTASRSPL